ncbi:MAG: lipase maturation factor family protein [Janthinobacterium lividum]
MSGPRDILVARWLFVRALAAIYFSAFFALIFQVEGLVGPNGILPSGHYLKQVANVATGGRFWLAPTLLWLAPDSHLLLALMWLGLVASLLALLNLWPRLNLLICFLCFLSFVAAAQDFSAYQSDGMLLEAGFITLFFAPPGLLPGWGTFHPTSRLSLWLLQWEWFRIYFESGLAKWFSGDPEWHNGTAMYEYYQNSPLPTWVGWYLGHAPRGFQIACADGTLAMEFIVVCLLFAGRRARLICFVIVTAWEVGVILTGNYAFLNYIVLALGFLLLADSQLLRLVPGRWHPHRIDEEQPEKDSSLSLGQASNLRIFKLAIAAPCLLLVGYATTVELISMFPVRVPLPQAPVTLLEPFRIANQYGLFATMTHGRYEIEFQGSDDGVRWTPYAYRYKPQDLQQRPGIYAPYQPRLDWNLWFASLGDWEQNPLVPLTQERLLQGNDEVLRLFANDPFAQHPPRFLRSVLWQYWFTSLRQRRTTGQWWQRALLGRYSPTLTPAGNGQFQIVEPPDNLPVHR